MLACVLAGLPTYRALRATGSALDKNDWLAMKQEEIVTKFGANVLSEHSVQEIRDVRGISWGPPMDALTCWTGGHKVVQERADRGSVGARPCMRQKDWDYNRTQRIL